MTVSLLRTQAAGPISLAYRFSAGELYQKSRACTVLLQVDSLQREVLEGGLYVRQHVDVS